MESVDPQLITDLHALREGNVSPARAPLYRAFLEIGTIADMDARDVAMQAVLDGADDLGESHLSILVRLAALPVLTGRQRELVDELLALLDPELQRG